MDRINQLTHSVLDDIDNCSDLQTLENLRIKYFGKNGIITAELKSLSSLDQKEKKESGQKLNSIKNIFFEKLEKKKKNIEDLVINEKLKDENIDISLPTRETAAYDPKIHPITQTINEIVSILGSMGLSYEEGPDIEDDFHNFTALNIPENHPARQMHDTFYLGKDSENFVLRTHTSPVQIRALKKKDFPLKIFAPGRTYRCDSDLTHTPMFHQVEGLVVDEGINFANLKWFLEKFCKTFFGNENLEFRFRPSYFPFTEPSAEVDINCKISSGKITLGDGDQWLEILGCGMVHPNVFKKVGIENKNLTGFAFGLGIERLAMLKYGIPDLRNFYDGDLRWLNHYGFSFFDNSDLSWK